MLIEGMKLRPIQLGKILCDMVREGGVDIIAPEQNMIADGNATQGDLARVFFYRDQCEISSAPADVDHQDQIPNSDPLPPIWVVRNPCVERSLRLFEEDHVVILCLFSCFKCQIARHGVKGCWYGYQHLMCFKRDVWILLVPCCTQVSEVLRRSLHGRDLAYSLRRR